MNKIHKNKAEAEKAIKRFAEVVKRAEEETGASFLADALDDSGMEYYVEAGYYGPKDGKKTTVKSVRMHFQELDL